MNLKLPLLFVSSFLAISCAVQEDSSHFVSKIDVIPINSPTALDRSNVGDVSAASSSSFRPIIRASEIFSNRTQPPILRASSSFSSTILDVALVSGELRNAECRRPEVAPFCIPQKFETRVKIASEKQRSVSLRDKFFVLEALNRPYSRESYNRGVEQRIRQVRSSILSSLSSQSNGQFVTLNAEKIFLEDITILVPDIVGEDNIRSVLMQSGLDAHGISPSKIAQLPIKNLNGFFQISTNIDLLKSSLHFRIQSVSGYEDPFALISLGDSVSVNIYEN